MVITRIEKKNEVYIKVSAEPHVHKELSEHFQFEVPQAKFMPQYQKYKWDGKIRLYSPATGEIYAGLFDYVCEFLDQKGYEWEVDESKHYGKPNESELLVSPEASRGMLDLWVCLSRQEITSYEQFTRHLGTIGDFYFPRQDRENL